RRLSDRQKDLEILLLRHQLRILQRKLPGSPRISVWEKAVLSVLAVRFKRFTDGTGKRLDEALLLFKPGTVLRWHQQLVRRKWTFRRAGRPRLVTDLEGKCQDSDLGLAYAQFIGYANGNPIK